MVETMNFYDNIAGKWYWLPGGWEETREGMRSPDGIEFWVTGPSGRWGSPSIRRTPRQAGIGGRYFRSILTVAVAAGLRDEHLPIEMSGPR